MIDLRDPLAVLAQRLPWGQIEEALAPKFKRKDRAGQCVEGQDWWGPTQQLVGAGVSRAGRPKLPIRLLASLLYLKHSFNLSDEEVCSRWSENVLWQFFSGMDYYEHRLPCDPTQIGRFRRDLGEEGLEQLLKATIETRGGLVPARRSNAASAPQRCSIGCIQRWFPGSWVVSHEHGLMLGARTFTGNPYDGHILSASLEQATNLTQDLEVQIKEVVVDLGYRGVDEDNPGKLIIHRGKLKSLCPQQKAWLRRRQAIEPAIGHLKSDHRLDRCWLKGEIGDALHAISCAAGYNLRWLLRAVARLGLGPIFHLLDPMKA